MLLIVAYDWTDWLALALIDSACGVFLILVLFQVPVGDYLMRRRMRKKAEYAWKLRQKHKRKYKTSQEAPLLLVLCIIIILLAPPLNFLWRPLVAVVLVMLVVYCCHSAKAQRCSVLRPGALEVNHTADDVLGTDNRLLVDDGEVLPVIAGNMECHFNHPTFLLVVRSGVRSKSHIGSDELSNTDARCLFDVPECPLIRRRTDFV